MYTQNQSAKQQLQAKFLELAEKQKNYLIDKHPQWWAISLEMDEVLLSLMLVDRVEKLYMPEN